MPVRVQNKVAPAPQSMPRRSAPPSLDLVADTATGPDADTTSAAAPTTARSASNTQHNTHGADRAQLRYLGMGD